MEARGNFASVGKSRGNENRRWHGTRRKCNIGDKGITRLCADSRCSLCCIIKTSFDIKFVRGATGWGRFGAGIYTSSTSSKFVSIPDGIALDHAPNIVVLSFRSNDYSRNESTSKWKALLLNKVVVGKGTKLSRDDPTLTQPPLGYDSVSIFGSFFDEGADQELDPRGSSPWRIFKLRRARSLQQRRSQAIISGHVREFLTYPPSPAYHSFLYSVIDTFGPLFRPALSGDNERA